MAKYSRINRNYGGPTDKSPEEKQKELVDKLNKLEFLIEKNLAA